MFGIGKHKWIGVFIEWNTDNFIVVDAKGKDRIMFYSKEERYEKNYLSLTSPLINLNPLIKQKLDIIGTKWEIRLTGRGFASTFEQNCSSRPSFEDCNALRMKILRATQPAIFVPPKRFIETEGVLTKYYGSVEQII